MLLLIKGHLGNKDLFFCNKEFFLTEGVVIVHFNIKTLYNIHKVNKVMVIQAVLLLTKLDALQSPY